MAARADPRAQVYIVDHLAPGAAIHRRVEVSNTTSSTMHVALYASAASINKGSFIGAAGHSPNSLSTWTSVSPHSTDVPAGGARTAMVTINVPRNAAPGEQYGVVWAEARSAPPTSGGVTQVSRVGVRLYLSVGPGGAPASNFNIESLTAARSPAGQPMVLAAVHNTGGRALDMNGTLALSSGPAGLSAGPFPATLGVTLAVGDTEPIHVAMDSLLPAGPWNAEITLHSGLLTRSAHATITFPSHGTSPPIASGGTSHRRLNLAASVFIALLVLLALLALSTAARLLVRQHRRRPNSQVEAGTALPSRHSADA